MYTSFEAVVSRELDITTSAEGNVRIVPGVYLVRVLIDQYGRKTEPCFPGSLEQAEGFGSRQLSSKCWTQWGFLKSKTASM